MLNSEIMSIFAPTESATLPVEQRTRAGLLFFDDMIIYTKQPLSIAAPTTLLIASRYYANERD